MKKLFSYAAVAALCVVGFLAAPVAKAADLPHYGPVTLISDVVVLAQAATNLFNNGTIDCRKQASVAVSITTSNTVDMNTSGAINGILFVRSVDGTHYETNGTYVTWVPVGKSELTTVTNINTFGAGYMKVLWVTNAAASGGNTTNVGSLHICYPIKSSAP